VLYAASARDPQATPPDFFDRLQLLLVVSALVVDGVALAAIAGRISEFGFTPNRVMNCERDHPDHWAERCIFLRCASSQLYDPAQ